MRLFISWSGQTSQQIANEMRKWLPLILPAVQPFITTTDIEKGAQWQGAIRQELEQSDYGIVVLTADNLASQWLAFEAGALSKHLGGRVATILFNIGHADVKPPLSIFQGTVFGENEFRKLISDINKNVDPKDRRGEEHIDALFPMLWTRIADPISLILQNAQSPTDGPPQLDLKAVVQEMLTLLRQQNSLLSSPAQFFSPIISLLHSTPRPSETKPQPAETTPRLSEREVQLSEAFRRLLESEPLSSQTTPQPREPNQRRMYLRRDGKWDLV